MLVQKLLAKLIPKLVLKFVQELIAKLGSNLTSKLGPNLGSFHNSNLVQDFVWKQPPEQSVGRPLHGRIVAGRRRTTTYRRRSALWTAAAKLPPFRENAGHEGRQHMGRRRTLEPVSWAARRSYESKELRVKAPAPELRRSLPYSVPRSTADSARGSSPNSTRG